MSHGNENLESLMSQRGPRREQEALAALSQPTAIAAVAGERRAHRAATMN
jgi:hypothetical protein